MEIKFLKKTPFYLEIEESVDAYFRRNNIKKTGNAKLYFKTIFWLTLVSTIYTILVFFTPSSSLVSLTLCGLLGFSFACIGFNIMHDAAHGSYSENQWINELFSHTLSLMGASVFIWKIKHNITHHTYTNIEKYDDDIETSPLLRLHKNQEWKWWYIFQIIYMWPLYALEYIGWVFLFDFQKFLHKKVAQNKIKMSRGQKWFFFGMKASYVVLFVIIPGYIVGWEYALIGYGICSSVCGLTISIVFQMAHVQEKSDFVTPEETLGKRGDFFKHQINTTADFASKNKIISWLLGGLNFQTVHHLFPKISHVHYPDIQKIIKECCARHNVIYKEYKTFFGIFISHIKHMAKLSFN